MKTRLGIFLLYLNLITQFALCQPNGRLHQVYGGSEFRLIHRPDISDSTYQIFLRKNLTWHGIQAGDANYIVSNTISISLVDTCSLRYAPITMLIYYESPSFLMNPISSFNPNTGDSASKRIFRVCSSSFQDSIIKFLSTGPNFGNGSGNIQPGFRDTFELLRDYWYDTLVNLPEPCGLWQIHDGGIAPWWSGTSYCGYGSGPSAFGSDFWFGSNVDTNYSPTYIYGNGVPNGADVSCKNGVTQINTSVANSSPYFLSYPTGVFVRNVPSFYAMNAVDPDGDSLVFSSISLVFPDSAQGNRPMSHFTPWAPFRQCIDYSASGNDTVITCFRNLNYLCPPGSVYPNCPRYDPVYNPFDTDSTFHINPNTGDITFIAKSAPQSPDLYIRCEEYRNGVWMGSVTRRIRFIIIDSTFYSQPKLKIDTANLVNCTYDSDFVFRACAGAPISIPFEALGINNVSQLKVKDNHPFALGTSSSVNYVNQATDSVRGVLQWTPPTNATGWYNLMVTVRDSVCSLTPYLFDHPYLLRIFIDDGVSAGKDTAICQGQSITLSAQILGNAPATWSVLSGSLNSLSCTNCSNPVASPTVTTTYVVQANLQGLNACKQKDTIVVRVHPAFTLLAKDTLLCGPATQAWLSAQVNPPVSGLTYQWSPSAGILSGANAPTVQLNPASATYVVTVSDTVGCFTRSDTVNIVYDPNFLPQLTAQPDGGICTGDSVQLSISGGGNMMWTPNY
ncbi:MAG: hypothetical protein JNM44_05910, partial [Chitinophagaceae bacterium]|nr:hypothetical protein [Chitinophagaceae bacterium]